MNILRKLFRDLTDSYWTIGFSDAKIPFDKRKFKDIKWLSPLKQSWIADPFILSYDENSIEVLVEHFQDSTQLGRICKLTVDRKKWQITSLEPILELSTHLSFPVIVRKDNKIYFYPENSASGSLNVYELVNGTKAEKVACLAKASLTDSIIFEKNGKYIMTTTEEPGSNKNRLLIYESNELFGAYNQIHEFFLSDNTARNAGYTIKHAGKTYKVSQENNAPIYGHGIVIYEMDEDFNLSKVHEIMPEGKYKGIHTMNQYNDLVVWDARAYRHRFLGPIFSNLYRLLRKNA